MPRSPTPNSFLSGVIMPRTMFLSISSTSTTRPSTHIGSDSSRGGRAGRRAGAGGGQAVVVAVVVVAVGTASLLGARMLALMVQPSLALSAPTRGEDGIDVRQRGDRDRRGRADGAAPRHRRARSGAGGHRGGQRAAGRLRAP